MKVLISTSKVEIEVTPVRGHSWPLQEPTAPITGAGRGERLGQGTPPLERPGDWGPC